MAGEFDDFLFSEPAGEAPAQAVPNDFSDFLSEGVTSEGNGPDTEWLDYPKKVVGGALRTGADVVGAGQRAKTWTPGADAVDPNSLGDRVRRGLNRAADYVGDSVSEGMKQTEKQSWLGTDGTDSVVNNGAQDIVAKFLSDLLPSLPSSVVTLGAAAIPGVGMGASAGLGATLSAGEIYNGSLSAVEKLADEELQAKNTFYAALRAGGLDELRAKRAITDRAIGTLPEQQAAITGVLTRFGGGAEAVAAGVKQHILRTILNEGATEFLDEATQADAEQRVTLQTQGGDYSVGKTLEGGVTGAITGGVMGAGTSAIAGGEPRKPRIQVTDESGVGADERVAVPGTQETTPTSTVEDALPADVQQAMWEHMTNGTAPTKPAAPAPEMGDAPPAAPVPPQPPVQMDQAPADFEPVAGEAPAAPQAPVTSAPVAPEPIAPTNVTQPSNGVPVAAQESAAVPPSAPLPATPPPAAGPVRGSDNPPIPAQEGVTPPAPKAAKAKAKSKQRSKPEPSQGEEVVFDDWREIGEGYSSRTGRTSSGYSYQQFRTPQGQVLSRGVTAEGKAEGLEYEGSGNPFAPGALDWIDNAKADLRRLMSAPQTPTPQIEVRRPEITPEEKARYEAMIAPKPPVTPEVKPTGRVLEGTTPEQMEVVKQAKGERAKAISKAKEKAKLQQASMDGEKYAKDKKKAEAAKATAEQREVTDAKILEILKSHEVDEDMEQAGIQDGSKRAALRKRLNAIVEAVEASGVVIPEGKVSPNEAPNVRMMKEYRAMARRLSNPKGRVKPEEIEKFLNADRLVRGGYAKDAIETKKIEDNAKGTGGSEKTTTNDAVDVNEGAAKASTASDGMVDKKAEEDLVAKVDGEVDNDVVKDEEDIKVFVESGNKRHNEAVELDAQKAARIALERAKTADKAGTFKVEAAPKKRVVNIPGKKPVTPKSKAPDTAAMQGWDSVEADQAPPKAIRGNTISRGGYNVDAVESTTVSELFGRIEVFGNKYRSTVPPMMRLLHNIVKDVPVHIVREIDGIYNGKVKNVAGFYTGKLINETTGKMGPAIVLEERRYTDLAVALNPNEAAHILLHEAVHAAFLAQMFENPTISAVVEQMRVQAKQIYEFRKRDGAADPPYNYFLTNADEFIAEAFSNPDVQKFLTTIKLSPQMRQALDLGPEASIWKRARTMWEGFVLQVRQVLGAKVDATLFDGIMRVGEVLANRNQATTPGDYNLDDSAIQLPDRVTDEVSTTWQGTREWVLKVQTLDHIARTHEVILPGLKRFRELVARKAARRDSLRKPFEERAKFWMGLDKKAKEAAWKVMEQATIDNVNLPNKPASMKELLAANTHLGKDSSTGWQAKRRLQKLHAEFMRLPANVRAEMLGLAQEFKAAQDKLARALAQNHIRLNKITDPRLIDLITTKVMGDAGFTENDEKVLGKGLVEDLRGIRELRVRQGMYFPLMRHGDFVVETTDGDLEAQVAAMGGTITRSGKRTFVEFRAAKDKDARAMAKAFAEKTNAKVAEVRRSWVDRSTGERIAKFEDTAGRDVDTIYHTPVEERGVFFFETRRAAEKFRKANKALNPSPVMQRDNAGHSGDELSVLQMSQLMAAAGRNHVEGVNDGQVQALKTAVQQATGRLMAGNRVQARALPRRGVQGASSDIVRSILTYAEAQSAYQAKIEMAADINDVVTKMRKFAGDRENVKDGMRSAVLNEIQSRLVGPITSPKEPNSVVQFLLTVSSIDKLFSPAYSVFNGMQVIQLSLGVVGGRYGFRQASIEMSKAYKDIHGFKLIGMGAGNTWQAVDHKDLIDTSDMLGWVKSRLQGQERELIGYLEGLNKINGDVGFEIAPYATRGAGPVVRAVGKVDRASRQLPAAVEVMNRSVAALMAYRLGKANGLSHDSAMAYAADVVDQTQGDYSNENASLYMTQNGGMQLALQFKKYAILVSQLYASTVYRAIHDADKTERTVAQRQLVQLLGVQLVLAGAVGMPIVTEVAKIGFMFAAMVGLGEGWEEQEKWLRGLARENLGVAGDFLSKGLPYVLGVDASSRVGLADMLTFGEPQKAGDTESRMAYLAAIFGGPALSMLMGRDGFMEGLTDLGNGDVFKGIAKMIPVKWISDTMKGADGYLSGRDGPGTAALRGAGFMTSKSVDAIEASKTKSSKREDGDAQRKTLTSQYMGAWSAAERAKTVSRIREYNKTAPWSQRISIEGLERSRKQREK